MDLRFATVVKQKYFSPTKLKKIICFDCEDQNFEQSIKILSQR